jgi:AcrR family transcriptional regulator
MPASERKKREYAQREKLIISTARKLLLDLGYLDLNMDRIAEVTEYSKGTIYQHFSCKEEILVQMLTESVQAVGKFLERGAQFQGTPREKMAALTIGWDLFIQLNPDHFKSRLLLQNETIRAKASPVLQKNLEKAEQNNMAIVSGVIREGVSQGYVQLREGVTPEEVSFGLWTGALGAYVLMSYEVNLQALGISDPRKAVWDNIHALLDGFGWHPLYHELNWGETRSRIFREIFPDESTKAGVS